MLRLAQHRDPLLEGEVGLEARVRLRLGGARGAEAALLEVLAAHERPQLGRAGEPLHEDVPRALDRRLGVGHGLLLVAEGEGPQLERLAFLRLLAAVAAVPDPVGERLEPRLAGRERAVLLLLPVRVVEVLERVGVEGPEDPLAQLGRERGVPLDRLDDDRLTRADLGGELAGLEHAADGPRVEAARAVAAVARDEGRRRARLRELQHGARGRDRDLGVARGEPGVEGGGERFGHGDSGKAPMLPCPGSREKTRPRAAPRTGADVAGRGRACYRSRVAPEPFFPEAFPVPPDAGKRLRALDKVELHQHVDGSIPADVTWELMHHYRLNPVDSLDEMRRHLEIQEGEEGTLLAYLDKMHYPLWVTQFYENISKVVEEIVHAAAAMGVKTLELRYAPLIHTYAGLTPRQSIRAALSGMNRAQRKNPEMKLGLIVITMRQHGPHIAKILARQALAEAQHLHERTGVVGFDIAGPERGNPPRLFRSAYEIARLGRLGLTAHAGEDAPTDYVWQAVDELGVDRIGHGCAAARDAELLKRLARDKIAVEVLPLEQLPHRRRAAWHPPSPPRLPGGGRAGRPLQRQQHGVAHRRRARVAPGGGAGRPRRGHGHPRAAEPTPSSGPRRPCRDGRTADPPDAKADRRTRSPWRKASGSDAKCLRFNDRGSGHHACY